MGQTGLVIDDSTYVISAQDRASGFWLASPGYSDNNDNILQMNVFYDGSIRAYFNSHNSEGYRPFVCLEAGVNLVDNGDGTYGMKKQYQKHLGTVQTAV